MDRIPSYDLSLDFKVTNETANLGVGQRHFPKVLILHLSYNSPAMTPIAAAFPPLASAPIAAPPPALTVMRGC